MSSILVSRALSILTLLTITVAGASRAYAQDIQSGADRQDLTGGANTINRPNINRPSVQLHGIRIRTVPVIKKIIVTPTTGTLSVDSEPRASILVEPQRGSEAKVGTIPPDDRQFIFNNLAPGRYRVAASLDGYEPAEKIVVITANRTTPATLDLKPVTQNVTFNTNIKTGEIRYAPVASYKEDGTGETKYRPTGVTSVVPIQNNRALLPHLRTGIYGVDIRAGEVGYQTLLGTVTVPVNDTISVSLKRVLSTKTFSAAWVGGEWDMPHDWHLASGLLSVNGTGLALPRDESYRYYTDFQLTSDARMRNGVAVSFVLRASDKQNYYLIRLTGGKADEPYLLRGFVVKNGASEPLQSITIRHLAATLKPMQFFKVHIKMKDNVINVSVEDSQTGMSMPLGILTDSYRHFTIGAVGIAGDDKEQSDYGTFIVCAPQCP